METADESALARLERRLGPVRLHEEVPMRRVLWGLYKKWTTPHVIYRSWFWGLYVSARERVAIARKSLPVPPQGGTGVVRPMDAAHKRLDALEKYVSTAIARAHEAVAAAAPAPAPARPPATTVPGPGMSAADQAVHMALAAGADLLDPVAALLDSDGDL